MKCVVSVLDVTYWGYFSSSGIIIIIITIKIIKLSKLLF